MSPARKPALADRESPEASAVPTRLSGLFVFLNRASISLSALALVYAFTFLPGLAARANQFDFSHYYVSALAMRQGIDPYLTDLTPLATSLGLKINEINHATYPPTFVLCFEPLTLLPPLPAYWLWVGMNILFLAGALYLLSKGLPKNNDLRLALVGLAILYAPVSDNFYYAQTQILILLLLTLFMRWMESGRQRLAGAILGVAVLLKLFPLILVGYLLLRRQRTALLSAGLTLISGGVLTLALVGLGRSLGFFQALPFLTDPYWLGRPANVALGAMVSRMFWYSAGYFDPAADFIRSTEVLLSQLFLLGLTTHATLKSSKLSGNREQHVIALWIITAVLLSPTAWFHYLVLLLIPYALLVRQLLRGEASMVAAWLGLASYVLAEFLMPTFVLQLAIPNWATWFLAIVPSLSLLLAYGSVYSLTLGSRQLTGRRQAVPKRLPA